MSANKVPVKNSVVQAMEADNMLTRAMKKNGLTRRKCACESRPVLPHAMTSEEILELKVVKRL